MRTVLPADESCRIPARRDDYQAVGRSVIRADAVDKVTGEAVFTGDLMLPGTLHAKVLRSPYAHADIVSIDAGAALDAPGVWAVVTGHEFSGRRIGHCINDQPVMAHTKVRFVGEPVAAVIADTPQQALRACELIRVEYNPIPAVFCPREAMKPDAPIIHEDLHEYDCFKTFCPVKGSNVFHHFKVRKGDIDEGFQRADHVFEDEFIYPHVSHCQMEPHGAVARWHHDGSFEIYASAQSPFLVRSVIAELFHIPLSKVRVVSPYIGGGFGGKSDCTIEPLTAYIAGAVPGRPVKLVLEREEMFCGSVIGRGCHVRIKTGVTNDGILTARDVDLAFNAGAYGEYCINVVVGGGQNSTGPYYVPAVKIDSRAVYTNLPFVGAFRGYGHPEGHWAAERQMDIIATKMGWDPVEFRMKNLLGPGKTNAIGQTITEGNGDVRECLGQVAKALELDRWKKSPADDKDGRFLRGKGLACLMKSPVMATNAPSMCTLRFCEDASVTIQVSATDMGQGSTTAMAQIAAETLMIPFEKIRVSTRIDTERHPYDWQTVASRTTWMCGNAVIRACRDAINQLKQHAAMAWGLDNIDGLHYDGANVKDPQSGRCLPVESLVMGYTFDDGRAVGGPVSATGYFLPPGIVYHNPETGQGNSAAEWTFGCQGVDLTIDRLTGEVAINRLVTAMDVGKVINPALARGQIIGAMVQALGQAVNEELIYSGEGKIRNDNLTDYKIPTLADLADASMDVIFLETPQHDGPYGARPLAEHGTVGLPPAYANAIADATGCQFYRLPINSDRLMEAILNIPSKEVQS